MILTILGTHNLPMSRLVRGMDAIAAETDEKVLIQRGHSLDSTKYAISFGFTSHEEMLELMMQARMIVTHDGAATLFTALRQGKPVIVVPRLRKYGEHSYDNKAELAAVLSERGLVKLVWEIDDLPEAIRTVRPAERIESTRDQLVRRFGEYVAELASKRTR